MVAVGSQVVDSLQAWFSKRIQVKSQVGEENARSLGQTPIDQLIDDYWTKQDSTLIPYIVGKRYQTPLITRQDQTPGHQAAVIYLKSGEQQVWRQPAQDMDCFVKLIQDELVGMDPSMLRAYSSGDVRQALSFYEWALVIYEQLYKEKPNHPAIAKILYNLGCAWHDSGGSRKAVSYLERALAIYEQVHR